MVKIVGHDCAGLLVNFWRQFLLVSLSSFLSEKHIHLSLSTLETRKKIRDLERGKEEGRMFGRVRPASSSLDSLHRPPSKIIKGDSLSIYEATLLKLKRGSKQDHSSCSEMAVEQGADDASLSLPGCLRDTQHSPCSDGVKIEASPCISSNEEVTIIDTNCSSASISPSSIDCQSTGNGKQQKSGNLSVLYLFSKYKSSQHAQSSSGEGTMIIENYSSFGHIGDSSSDCQSLSSTKKQYEEESVSSFPMCQM